MNSEIVKFLPTSQSYIKYKLVLLLLTIWGGTHAVDISVDVDRQPISHGIHR